MCKQEIHSVALSRYTCCITARLRLLTILLASPIVYIEFWSLLTYVSRAFSGYVLVCVTVCVYVCMYVSKLTKTIGHGGVARNLLRGGQKRGSGDGGPPAGQGQSPGVVWQRSPQKLGTHAEYSTEQSHRSSQIVYCSESDYTLRKFPATTEGGGHAPMSQPLATPLIGRIINKLNWEIGR